MNMFKRIARFLLLIIVLQFNLNLSSFAHKSQYTEFYHQIWQLVRDNYYDANFHGVNWKQYEHKYDKQIKTQQDAYRYSNLMLSSLEDPYTRLLDPTAFGDESDAIDSRVVGIGINIQQSKSTGYLVITRTLDDSPAALAGLREGDELISIDNHNSIGLNPEQAAELIRGKAGTTLDMIVRRHDDNLKFIIERQQITIHPVTAKRLNDDIGYIQLSTFISGDAASEFKAALNKLASTKGIILDLRSNPGGLLSNAFKIASMLLPQGNIVTTISRTDCATNYTNGKNLTNNPIVVLVDEESASASEILAGALKDNSRALIVGTRTYGKGLVQEINQLPFGAAVHITVSKYLTPSGLDINKIGISPDVVVQNKAEQLAVAKQYLNQQIAYRNSNNNLANSSVALK